MGRINKDWHQTHVMPANPTEQQRAEWHYGHALNCGCRTATPSILRLLEVHGFRLPPDAPGLAASASTNGSASGSSGPHG